MAAMMRSLSSCLDATPVTGCVDRRIDGEACAGEDKGRSRPLDLFNGMAIQGDGLPVASSGVMTVGGAVLLAVLVEQLRAVVRPDAIAQVVKQFDDGEGLLWRPIGWDFEGNGERQTI